jgi:hypothetical protein
MERPTEMPTHGGLAPTFFIALASFASGAFVDALHALNRYTAGITSGQAALVVGFTGLALQYGPRAVRWAALRVVARIPKRP